MLDRFIRPGLAAAALVVAALPVWAQESGEAGTGAGSEAKAEAEAAKVPGTTVLARVNGHEITLAHIVAMREQLPDRYKQIPDPALFKAILDQLVQQELLAQWLEKQGIDRATQWKLDNARRATLAGAAVDRIAGEPVTEEELKAAYDEVYGSKPAETEYNASHILVKTREEAEAIIAELNKGADFAELAKARSQGPSGKNGGALGWFGKGMMVKPFEDAVTKLEKGQISEPVQTQFGWHVIKLNDVREKPKPSLEQVRAELEDRIRTRRVEERIKALEAEAKVERPAPTVPPEAIRDTSVLND
ncbi:MAG: peptidylprolyl isomerase [Alphaproteobacteria bacterium]|nr:MAG: peptidylprolyl isomerase [Alphaproteobacteria bacterium]